MTKSLRSLTKTLSVKLSLKVIAALATLLMVALLIMFFFSRKAVKEEALRKGGQTLESTVQHIDNILLDVEQSSGNIYWKMLSHLNEPEKVEAYCQRVVDCNPYVVDCRVVRDSVVATPDTTSNGIVYENPSWTDPYKSADGKDAITSFRLPIYTMQGKVGMLRVDVSLALLSKIVLEVKPSPNSFCTLLGRDGTFIVHPDSTKLNHNAIEVARKTSEPSVVEAAQAMVSDETGYMYVKLQGEDCYVFYKPFERTAVPGRAMSELGWSAGIIYPENDIFGDYNHLLRIVLIVAIVGLLLLLVFCQFYIHRQLKPLRMLEKSAKRIAEGCYDEPIPDTHRDDEVGRLQKHFQEMQQSLSTNVSEMNRLTDTLRERGEVLQAAYEQAESADRMKTNFLYNMSNKMMAPSKDISKDVSTICSHYDDLTEEETNKLTDEIQRYGNKITDLLNRLIVESEKMPSTRSSEKGKAESASLKTEKDA